MIYRILSLDGGGIKGLFTSTILERLSEERADFLDRVDLVAGTSTGGLIALGLAAGLEPAELSELYRRDGPKIFDDSFLDDLIDLGSAIGADYSHRGTKRALRRIFGAETRLRDLKKRVLIPAFDLDAPAEKNRPRMWKPKFFHNFPGRDSDGDELVVDVALRTASAPTYFPSYQGYVDGGIVVNNPSMAALAQALDGRKGKCSDSEEILLLSVGTGAEPKYIKGKKHDWGWGQWARPLVSIMISGSMGIADYQCKQILGERYARVNPYLERGVDLDDASESTLSFLEESARATKLDPVIDWLDRSRW